VKRRPNGALGRAITVGALAVIGLLWLRLLVVHPHASDPAWVDPRQQQQMQRKLTEISGAVDQLQQASQRGETRHTVVHLTAGDVNAMLAAQPEVRTALEVARVHDPHVRLEKGRVITTATVERRGVPLPVQAEGRLAARDGLLLYASESVRVGGMTAHVAIRRTVDARVQDAFRRLEEKTNAHIDRVTVGPDLITLSLTSEPE
jgi:hypothetical protein